MSASKKTILLLKGGEAEKSSKDNEYEKELQNVGLNVTQIPVLAFIFINQDVLRQCLIRDYEDYEGIVFTSPRAVEAVNQVMNKEAKESWSRRQQRQQGGHKSVYVVGETTASKVHQLLGWQSLGSEAGNASNLAEIIAKCEKPGSKLLFPCGNLKRNELENGLRQASIGLHSVISYETQPREDLSSIIENMNCQVDYVAFFSPSGVKAALPLLRKKWPQFDSKATVVAMGPTTAQCLREQGCQQPLVAAKPNAQCLTTLIKESM